MILTAASPLIVLASSAFLFSQSAPPASPAAAAAAAQPGTIMIDGSFNDWSTIPVAVSDPADAADAFVDLGEVRISSDSRYVYLLIALGKTVNAQGLDGTASVLFDADGDPKSGSELHGLPGVDLVLDLTPTNLKEPGSPGMGMGLRAMPAGSAAANQKLSTYDIGLLFAPTHAGTRMEYRLDRGVALAGAAPAFGAGHFTGKVVFVDLNGQVRDETATFRGDLVPFATGAARSPETAEPVTGDPQKELLARTPDTSLRILTWNAERGALVTRPDFFTKTFMALQPDVILLQELTSKNTREQIEAILNSMPSLDTTPPWTVVFGAGGDDLRCAVASRVPIAPVEVMKLVTFDNRPDRSARIAAAAITVDGKRLLVTSLHLKCCGRAGGPEDELREAEVAEIRKAIAKALAGERFDGVLLAGDFNLVGGRGPLDQMVSKGDMDGTDLAILDAYQLDGQCNMTWEDSDTPFAPGRLDYMVYTDSSIKAVHCFVYDSRDLSDRWLKFYALEATDTAKASDHLPVVADFVWTK